MTMSTASLASVKALMIDLSGTIHVENSPILGAVEAVHRLKEHAKIPFKFVTNTTKVQKNIMSIICKMLKLFCSRNLNPNCARG